MSDIKEQNNAVGNVGNSSASPENTHRSGKNHLYSWSPVCLAWIQ